jgi:hypothetical protein
MGKGWKRADLQDLARMREGGAIIGMQTATRSCLYFHQAMLKN